jgi:hypothetical protein|uniref:Uncharacterized protein n=1 Tax=viral metagenome TaxID=1070528 RepID=A0A6C0IWU3_9ZZZZ
MHKLDSNEMREKISYIQTKVLELSKQDTNNTDIEMYFMENDPDFYEKYPYLIKKLIKGGSLEFLEIMLENIEKIEKGEQTQSDIEKKLGADLANQFLYPSIKKE